LYRVRYQQSRKAVQLNGFFVFGMVYGVHS
jgi:hypothetical protein